MDKAAETPSPKRLVSSTQLGSLRSSLGNDGRSVLLAVHDYPDPDALASALAFQVLAGSWGVSAIIAHGGGMGRPENKALVKALSIELTRFEDIPNLTEYRGAMFLDTQPGAKNQSLPPSVRTLAVVDHHRLGADSVRFNSDPVTGQPFYADIRLDVGSSSTLALGYLEAAEIVPDARLATALFLGVKTDTANLMRDARMPDILAYTRLLPLADLPLAAEIISPPLGREHFRFLDDALRHAVIYGHSLVADCGAITSPDMISLVSDEFIKARDVRYALAHGAHGGRLYLSLRAKPPQEDATRVLLKTIRGAGRGGGHNLSAGGFMNPGRDLPGCAAVMLERFLAVTGAKTAVPTPLLGLPTVQ
ncbi:MAG: hypothetical protein LBT97_00410 [Planctomycetota bacterium]|jgi:nanoRNase/pAp phosphatase (c-di-AMP/oligoRNAs hydrolase)|nr:hypothetical protein [Planctomycetota bacterium]